MMNTNRFVALAEMTREQREMVKEREAKGWEFDGMNGSNVYMHSDEVMEVIRIDSRGRAFLAK